jgi:kelch-like protein 17 (actinfilin)
LLDDLVEKQQKEVVLHDVDPLALTLLVEFAYTGEILITEENVQVVTHPSLSVFQSYFPKYERVSNRVSSKQ